MIDRTPTPREERPALPAFDAVPRRNARHDGWTPPRQVAFIEALADTGSVRSAATQVNMSTESAYALRRAPGAAGFARAWEAALDMGLLRLKDEAFDRALNGELVPVVSGGKLLGYRRKRSDALLTFLLRHYGAQAERLPDGPLAPPARRAQRHRRAAPQSVRAEERPSEGEACPERLPAADNRRDASRSTAALPVLTDGALIPAPPAAANAIVADFEGVPLDEEAQAQIVAILTACAARTRALEVADDPEEVHIPEAEMPLGHPDAIGPSVRFEAAAPLPEGEETWRTLDLPDQRDAIAAAVAAIKAKKASGEWDRELAEESAAFVAKEERSARLRAFLDSGRPVEEWEG